MPIETAPNLKNVSPVLLRLAIIRALISAPNHSHRYNTISDLVIKSLNIRTRGAPRDELRKKIMHEVRSLIRRNIVTKYNNNREFPRLKLRDVYPEYLRKLEKSLAHSEGRWQQGSLPIEQDVDNAVRNLVDESTSVHIPDLPDLPESHDLRGESFDSDFAEDSEYPDDEAMELIDALVQPESDALDSEKNQVYQRKGGLSDVDAADILSLVKKEYENQGNVTIRQTYGELQLSFPFDNETIYVLFTYRPVHETAIITGYVPFVEGTAETVLRKYSGFDGTAVLCMETLGNLEYYAIRQRLELPRYSNREVIGSVAEIVLQAKRLIEFVTGIIVR